MAIGLDPRIFSNEEFLEKVGEVDHKRKAKRE